MFILSLKDRVLLCSLLPKEGSYEKLILAKDILKKTELTSEEIKEFEVETISESGIKWNKKGVDATFQIEFSDSEKNFISSQMKKLSEEEKLTVDHLDLYKTFL